MKRWIEVSSLLAMSWKNATSPNRSFTNGGRRQSSAHSDDHGHGGCLFAEVVVGEETDTIGTTKSRQYQIQISGRAFNVSLPATYPVEDLVKVILAVKG